MGFRFHKSVRILPGVRLNFSKSGVSTSVGGRGVTLNFSKRGVRRTVDLPGSGVSYTDHVSYPGRGRRKDAPASGGLLGRVLGRLFGAR